MEKEREGLVYRPNQNSFPCAIMNCHYVRYPIEYFFAAMHRFRLTDIELFGAMPNFYIEDVDEALLERVRHGCQKYGLRIVRFTPAQGVYPFSISVNEPAPRRRSIAMAKRSIEVAEQLGAQTMLISPGFGYESEPYDIRWGLCRDALIELGEHARRHHVVLTVEPLTPMTSNVINTSTQAAKMLQEVDLPSVKSMLDIGVMNFMGETVDEYFDNLGSDLLHVHFTDGPGAHVALGDGSFPMEAYASQIIRRGFAGTCSFEINDKRYLANPDAAMEKTLPGSSAAGTPPKTPGERESVPQPAPRWKRKGQGSSVF